MKTRAKFPRHAGGEAAGAKEAFHGLDMRLRPVALAVLMTFAATGRAAAPGTALPAGTIPTGGAVMSGDASIAAPQATATGQFLRIDQTSQKATIDWQTFDIAGGSHVHFNQPGSTAETLNRIRDANPSLIQGRLTANGRVYLINQNGILFDRGSQVDVHTLIASSLDIPDSVFNNGLLSAPGSPVATGSLKMLVDASGVPLTDLEGRPLSNSVSNYGTMRSVEVDRETGDVVIDPDTGKPGEPGGAIMLFAPQAENRGQITANNGQVVLAAGERVYLSVYYNINNPDPMDPNGYLMRGLVVRVQSGNDPLNLTQMIAANFGSMRTDRGNTTMTGMIVNQSGRISANTAATINGSIWLKADATQGKLITSADSVTETQPVSDGTTLAEDQDYHQFRSVIQMQGGTIDHHGSVAAPGGSIDITANRLFLATGSKLSTAGIWSDLPYDSNFIDVKLTSFDLRDSPVQKNGYLIGQTVTVDARNGSPLLFDISEKLAGIQRSVAEKAARAGDITIAAGEFISAPGSEVDISGGGYRYGDGSLITTYLVSQGRLYDVRTAPVDLVYDGVVKVGSQADGYVHGYDAGTLLLNARQVVMGGDFNAGVTVGPNQRSAGKLPAAGKLILGTGLEDDTFPVYNLRKVVFAPAPVSLPAGFDAFTPMPEYLQNQVVLPVGMFGGRSIVNDSQYRTNGFGHLEVRARDEIDLPEGLAVDFGPGGSALLISRLIDIEGDLKAAGGELTLNARATVGGSGDPEVRLGSDASLSVAGGWINDAPGLGGAVVAPNVIDGGKVNLSGNLRLEEGGLIDASGGALYSAAHKLSYGKGGSISLQGSIVTGKPRTEDEIGRIELGSTLMAYGGRKGGSLSIGAGKILIGSDSVDPFAFSPDPAFFTRGGFASFDLAGFQQVDVSPGTDIRVIADSRVIDPVGFFSPTGTDMSNIGSVSRLDQYMRGPTSLSLSAMTDFGSGVNIGTGSSISTDPLGSISVSSITRLAVDGALTAPGGTINIKLDQPVSGLYGGETLEIGPNAVISTAGMFVPELGLPGQIIGRVLAGGDITVSARKNDLNIAPGAIIDVGGASHVVDIYETGARPRYARRMVNSEAGKISIRATENAVLAGAFLGHADPAVAGGTFDLSLYFHDDPPNEANPDPQLSNYSRIIHVGAAPMSFATAADKRQTAISIEQIESGGFDRVLLNANGQIAFEGNAELSPRALLRLDTPEINVNGGGLVKLSSAQVEFRNTPNDFRLSTFLDEPGTRKPVATHAGAGRLDVTAGMLSLAGHLTVNGVREVGLASQGDLRFAGFPVGYTGTDSGLTNTLRALSGSLTTEGDLVLAASQVYPATLVDYTLSVARVDDSGNRSLIDGGRISVLPGAAPANPVLSAGGSLTLDADIILNKGVVKAPLGIIRLQAGSELALAPDSVVSASADGLIVPFGGTREIGQSLWYGDLAKTFDLPEKRIILEGPSVDIQAGAVIDNAGGGEILATEWVPGIGGSTDVLAAQGVYAILPGVSFPVTDSYLEGRSASAADAVFDAIRLADNNLVGSGTFALLPAYYALLPGAYLVRVADARGGAPVAPDSVMALNDGSMLVAGKLGLAGTGISQSTWTGVVVEQGSNALRQAEYRQYDSQYFAGLAAAEDRRAPVLPRDGGHLSVGATRQLQIMGNLLANPAAGGAIGQVDIYSNKIAVVSQPGDGNVPAGYVGLAAGDLSRLNANLLLGGIRSSGPDGVNVKVVTQDLSVDLDEGDSLQAPEIILAATDRIDVGASTSLRADGPGNAGKGALTIEPDSSGKQYGALLRLSSGEQVSLARKGTLDFSRGTLAVAEGARLEASGSMILDATHELDVAGDIVLPEDGALTIAAGNIRLGSAPKVVGSLVLGADQLARLEQIRDLTMKSYTTVDIFGGVELGRGTGSLIVDAAAIQGNDSAGPANALFDYDRIVLINTGDTPFAAGAAGTGTLTLKAGQLVLGKGEKTLAGFAKADLDAGVLTLQDAGALNAASDLGINAGLIVADRRADQTINACASASCDESTPASGWRDIAITSSTPASAPSEEQAGGRMLIAGKSIDFAGRVIMPSGRLNLVAHGDSASDGIRLREDSVIDLASFEKGFAGRDEFNQFVDAGRLVLVSDSGSVVADAGSLVNIDGGMTGGNAGVLSIKAANGQAQLNGSMTANASPGYQGGSADIDVESLGNIADLNAVLEAAGFGRSRYLRARTGNIELADTLTMTAQEIQLVADAGAVNVAGTLDASGAAGGGRVEIDAGRGIHLYEGSRILANGTSADTAANAAYSDGGKAGLYARDGELVFDDGALIDVSANSEGKSSGGEVVFSAPRTADGTGVLASLHGRVKATGGTASVENGRAPQDGLVIVEGFKPYMGITQTSSASSTSGNVYQDFNAFMAAADAIHDGAMTSLNAGGSELASGRIKVRAGVELVSSGEMTVNSAWDLTNPSWLRTGANQAGGRLALRAANGLTVNASLGLANDISAPVPGWSLSLAGGADIESADPLAVTASSASGDVKLAGSGAKLRTTTGDIRIAAGRDFVIADRGAVVYTAGLPAIADGASNRFLAGGGDVDIRAGRNIVGSNGSAQWLNDWLRRTTYPNASQARYKAGGWWADRSKFAHGIATFGGGDIAISAGGEIQGVSASVASSAAVAPDLRSLQGVYGGGDLRIDAGGGLFGGQFLVGRGHASIVSADAIGASGSNVLPTIWLQGYSVDPALEAADVRVEALGDITLATVSNPTVLPTSGYNNSLDGYKGARLYFFSYAPDASASLVSVGGNVVFDNSAPTVSPALSTAMSAVLPPQFTAAALQGSVGGKRLFETTTSTDLYQYPDTNGKFMILAAADVHDLALHQSDVLPELLPQPTSTVFAPASTIKPGSISLTTAGFVPLNNRLVTPADSEDYRYAVVSASGNVADGRFYFPKPSIIEAGRDVSNVMLDLQNLENDDLSIVSAGRDFKYTAVLSNNKDWDLPPHLRISGPGRLVVQAGRNISMGVADSIDAGGSNFNYSLPTTDSAALTLIAGYSNTIDQDRIDWLFENLLEAGAINDQESANLAIKEVFGEQASGGGSITMYRSRISTEGGSPIDLLVPFGDINVGLPTPNGGNIGILTNFGGGIRAYLSGDVNVNLSKVVTLQGGDILLYTSNGNIDAGRGPRDSRTTQPPRLVDEIDPQTNQPTGAKLLIPPLDVGGSGIRTLSFDPDGPGPQPKPSAGNVYLFAPSGTVDAGEAGVSSAGNVIVVAQQVLNASNFSAGGSTSGVPAVSSAPVAAPVSASADSAASSKIGDSISQSASKQATSSQLASLSDAFRPTFITVEVLSFGDEADGTDDEDEDSKKKKGK